MSTLPKHSKSNGGKQKSLVMTLKPCPDEKSYYRVRLLAFAPPPGSMNTCLTPLSSKNLMI